MAKKKSTEVPLDQRAVFLAFSSALTGFPEWDLEGTGLVSAYLQFLGKVCGAANLLQFLTTASQALAQPDPEAAIKENLWSTPFDGPITQGLLSLWYTGQWNPNSFTTWQQQHNWSDPDPHTSNYYPVPTQGYVESLLWKAIHAHPPGAKPTGFASWAEPPLPAGESLFPLVKENR